MEILDMAEVVETFRRKFMEGAAGTAGRVADACAGLVATTGGMAPHDMELEPARLVGGVPDGLSAAAVTAAALDELILRLRAEKGMTFVVVTHELPSIFAIGDRAAMFDRARHAMIALGTPRELRDSSDDPFVRAFFRRSSRADGAPDLL